jgi:ABC-type Fe3+/spermidine/putrescine transport system ATPase subunit
MMFQKAYLFPFLSVAENIGFGLKVQGAKKETIRAEVARMLDLIDLPGIQRRKPAQLSGGEQQRVALARALVTNPRLLLLDEPLNSLDTAIRQNLQGVIRKIQKELGITTILVTHDLGEAMAMSDRISLLLNGEIVAIDEPDQLFHRPRTLEAAKFMGVTTFFKGQQFEDQLDTSFGVLKIPDAPGKSGQSTFAIRPEHIRIQKEKGENTLPGKVSDCIFRGEYIEYQALLNTMTVQARMPMPAPMFYTGETVQVYFPPEHLFTVEG